MQPTRRISQYLNWFFGLAFCRWKINTFLALVVLVTQAYLIVKAKRINYLRGLRYSTCGLGTVSVNACRRLISILIEFSLTHMFFLLILPVLYYICILFRQDRALYVVSESTWWLICANEAPWARSKANLRCLSGRCYRGLLQEILTSPWQVERLRRCFLDAFLFSDLVVGE